MINIKELSIGNWIKISGTPVQILGIRIESQVYVLETEEADYAYAIDADIEPIPITPEILEKNGWQKIMNKDEEYYHYYNSTGDGYVKISLWDGGCGDWGVRIKNYDKFNDNEVIYNNDFIFLKVHQLQNILTLCEINKEIKL